MSTSLIVFIVSKELNIATVCLLQRRYSPLSLTELDRNVNQGETNQCNGGDDRQRSYKLQQPTQQACCTNQNLC